MVQPPHLRGIPIEASPVRVEREDNTTNAKDGLCFVEVRLFIVRSAKSDRTNKHITLC